MCYRACHLHEFWAMFMEERTKNTKHKNPHWRPWPVEARFRDFLVLRVKTVLKPFVPSGPLKGLKNCPRWFLAIWSNEILELFFREFMDQIREHFLGMAGIFMKFLIFCRLTMFSSLLNATSIKYRVWKINVQKHLMVVNMERSQDEISQWFKNI